jgi:hypothetical protein
MTDPLGRFIGEDVVAAQRAICARYKVDHYPTRPDLKLGFNFLGDRYPINGMREPVDPEYNALSGWWIWNGERSDAFDKLAFEALHVAHVIETCPHVLPYLGLPPGWRFLIAPGYEDVWEDAALLHPS